MKNSDLPMKNLLYFPRRWRLFINDGLVTG
jgi:hypothetical protein